MAMYKLTQTHSKLIPSTSAKFLADDKSDKNRLPLLVDIGYSHHAPYKTGVGFRSLKLVKATHDAPSVFFCVQYIDAPFLMAWCIPLITVIKPRSNQWNTLCRPSMVALMGQPSGWLVSFTTSTANPVNVTTPIEFRSSGGDSLKNVKEIATMATTPTQTQFKFLFLSIKRSDTTAKPCRIAVTAPNENSARMLLARDYVLSFAGRLPVQHSGRV